MRPTLSLLMISLAGATLLAADFRASAVKVDITPQDSKYLVGYAARKSTGVHDRIHHRVLAMDDGATQVFIASSDFCLFSPGFYDEVAEELRREMGIEPRQFWWTLTHTHSAPEVGQPDIYKMLLGRSDHEWDREYTAYVRKSLVDAVREARGKLEPARLTAGIGKSWANINRRARDPEGRVSLGLNPEGVADRQIGLVRVERADGSPIALLSNYAIHGTVLGGQNLLISGDCPGVVASYVESKTGAIALFVNGAAGNMAPIYSVYPNPKAGHLSEFNVLLGDRILDANRALGPAVPRVHLWAGEKIVESPLREGLTWPENLPRFIRAAEAGPPLVRMPVRFLRINDTLVWGAPVEMFCEIAMHVREQSPFTRTLFFGYTNGWLGYLPTAKGFEEGGYEPRTSPFTARIERDLLDVVVPFIQGMPR